AQAWRSERAELIKDKNPPDFFRLRMSLRQERELHRPNEHCEEKCLNSRSNECSPGALNRFDRFVTGPQWSKLAHANQPLKTWQSRFSRRKGVSRNDRAPG